MWTDEYPKDVALKNGRRVTIRVLANADFDRLLAFFKGLSDADRLYLQHDVTDPELVRRWTTRLDFDQAVPLVAEDEGKIVAAGTLHRGPAGWMQHLGQIRLATSPSHRRLGLGSLLFRELLQLAEDRNFNKLYSNVIENDERSVKFLQRLGFRMAGVLKDLVRDQAGRLRNLVVLTSDVAEAGRTLEDWIQDSMVSGSQALEE